MENCDDQSEETSRKRPSVEPSELTLVYIPWLHLDGEDESDYSVPAPGAPLTPIIEPLFMVICKIEEEDQEVLPDPCATHTIIPLWFFEILLNRNGNKWGKEHLKESRHQIYVTSGHRLIYNQLVELKWSSGVTTCRIPCLLDTRMKNRASSNQSPILLGINGLRGLGFLLLSPTSEVLLSPSFHEVGYTVTDARGVITYNDNVSSERIASGAARI